MDDLISRQAAIDALEREKTYCTAYLDGYTQTDYFKQYNMGLSDGIKALNKLPSAQPEFFEWCHDCKEYDTEAHCCHRWTKVIRNTVEELKSARHCEYWDSESNFCVLNRPSNGYAKEYTIEQVNQARYIGFIEGKESAQPDPSMCWGCNCPKMSEQRWIPCLECEKRCDKWEHSKTLQE